MYLDTYTNTHGIHEGEIPKVQFLPQSPHQIATTHTYTHTYIHEYDINTQVGHEGEIPKLQFSPERRAQKSSQQVVIRHV
jgi:hypothetical protein